jgi:ATP phosphoribosyltransferase
LKLRIAVQKSGRLSDGSIDLLRKCGIGFSNGMGKLRTEAADFPMELFFLRDDDIPDYVADGVADAGIVGQNGSVEIAPSIGLADAVVCVRGVTHPPRAP